MPNRIRLLPILILVGVGLLALVSANLGHGLSRLADIGVPPLQAETASSSGATAPVNQAGQGSAAPSGRMQIAQAGGGQQGASNGSGAIPAGRPLRSEYLADHEELSPQELEVLQALAARRKQLEAREKDIADQERLLLATEQRVEEKIAELQNLKATIEGLLRQHDEQEEERLAALVKIYENMKPKEAATIFNGLDLEVALSVIERMKERKVAPILQYMDPEVAKQLTVELAQRRQLPIPKE